MAQPAPPTVCLTPAEDLGFTDIGRPTGDATKNLATRTPETLVFDTKRMIGRKTVDPILQSDIKLWPFNVIAEACGKPMIQEHFHRADKQFHPVEALRRNGRRCETKRELQPSSDRRALEAVVQLALLARGYG